MRRLLAGVVGLALAGIVAAQATAHVVPQPSFLTPGEKVTVAFSAPNERPPHVLTSLTIIPPAGITLAPATPPPGWRFSFSGRTAEWSRASTSAGTQPDALFRIGASTTLEPGTATLNAAQRYDDGGVVRWKVSFTILPAAAPTPKQHLLPAVVTAILGLVVIALLLMRMRDRSRPDLQKD